MWEVLSAFTPDAEKKLNDQIQEVDLRDGQAAGKLSRNKTECSKCKRPLHIRLKHVFIVVI